MRTRFGQSSPVQSVSESTTNYRQKKLCPRKGNISNNHPNIEDPIINIENVQGFVGNSLHVADNNMHNSDDKDIQKDVSFLNATDISWVICPKKLKKEKKQLKDS